MPKVERPSQELRFSAVHAPNPSACLHRRVPTSSQSTTDNGPNRSTGPGAQPVHADDRAHCSDARTTVRQPPDAGTRHGRQGPGRHHRSPPQRTARIRLRKPLTHRPTPSRRGPHSVQPIITATHAQSPHPKTPTQANLTPPSQAAHLQSIRTPYSFA